MHLGVIPYCSYCCCCAAVVQPLEQFNLGPLRLQGFKVCGGGALLLLLGTQQVATAQGVSAEGAPVGAWLSSCCHLHSGQLTSKCMHYKRTASLHSSQHCITQLQAHNTGGGACAGHLSVVGHGRGALHFNFSKATQARLPWSMQQFVV